ncbi:hypothetical protein EV361DRAFT_874949, partial [Lentinula raphanica]
WKSWFYEYLRGVGHVQHSAFQNLLSDREVQKHATDAGLRARSFLLHATGSVSMPRDHKIKMSFTFKDNEDGSALAPFEVHACFADVTVNICKHVKALLDEKEVDSQALFNIFIHGPLAAFVERSAPHFQPPQRKKKAIHPFPFVTDSKGKQLTELEVLAEPGLPRLLQTLPQVTEAWRTALAVS